MKPRASAGAVPLGLLVFDGREFATAADWTEAYEAWVDARDQWESEHPGLLLRVGWPEGSPPRAPAEPGVTVSRHRAPTILINRGFCTQAQCAKPRG